METTFRLQACKFKRIKDPLVLCPTWELGFARVPDFGMSDIAWIVDAHGFRVEDLHDYRLLEGQPGYYAQV